MKETSAFPPEPGRPSQISRTRRSSFWSRGEGADGPGDGARRGDDVEHGAAWMVPTVTPESGARLAAHDELHGEWHGPPW